MTHPVSRITIPGNPIPGITGPVKNPITPIVKGVESLAGAAEQPVKNTLDFYKLLTEKDTWLRVFEVGFGLVLILIAASALINDIGKIVPVPPEAKTIAKDVVKSKG